MRHCEGGMIIILFLSLANLIAIIISLIGGVQVEGAAGVVVEAELEALLRERHGEDGQGCGEDYHRDYHEDECC